VFMGRKRRIHNSAPPEESDFSSLSAQESITRQPDIHRVDINIYAREAAFGEALRPLLRAPDTAK
jgi:hypothetical protein